jgi:glycosyltransferase involved in cell wall biosynthesis
MFFSVSINQIALKEFIYYDLVLASKISNGLIPVDQDTVIIGRNGMSLSSFREVKKRGGTLVLHSQWMHPNVQNKYLNEEFSNIGLKVEPILKQRLDRQLEEIQLVDKIWCISSLVTESYLVNGVQDEKLFDSSLGVDFPLYGSIKSGRENDSDFNILFVGNVNPEKGVHTLLKAVLGLELGQQRVKMIFNGVVPEYFGGIFSDMERQLTQKGVEVIVQPGIPLDNYSRASIFVLPSVHESFGLVVLEAMASGLPVIVSNKVGAKDCVRDGDNGFIFNEGDDQKLTEIINSFASDSALLEQMGARSREIAKEYDWPHTVKELVTCIES